MKDILTTKKVYYTRENLPPRNPVKIEGLHEVVPDQTFTVRELIDRMGRGQSVQRSTSTFFPEHQEEVFNPEVTLLEMQDRYREFSEAMDRINLSTAEVKKEVQTPEPAEQPQEDLPKV